MSKANPRKVLATVYLVIALPLCFCGKVVKCASNMTNNQLNNVYSVVRL